MTAARPLRWTGRSTIIRWKLGLFVEREEDYGYSRARDFYGKKGLIELSHIV